MRSDESVNFKDKKRKGQRFLSYKKIVRKIKNDKNVFCIGIIKKRKKRV